MTQKKRAPKKNDFTPCPVLSEDILTDYMKSHYRAIPRLVKLFYFNKEKPSEMTLKFDPTNPSMLYTIKNNVWVAQDKDYLLDTLVLEIWSQLFNVFIKIDEDSFKDTLVCEETYQRIEAFMDEFRDFCNRGPNASWNDQKKNVFSLIVLLSKKLRP